MKIQPKFQSTEDIPTNIDQTKKWKYSSRKVLNIFRCRSHSESSVSLNRKRRPSVEFVRDLKKKEESTEDIIKKMEALTNNDPPGTSIQMDTTESTQQQSIEQLFPERPLTRTLTLRSKLKARYGTSDPNEIERLLDDFKAQLEADFKAKLEAQYSEMHRRSLNSWTSTPFGENIQRFKFDDSSFNNTNEASTSNQAASIPISCKIVINPNDYPNFIINENNQKTITDIVDSFQLTAQSSQKQRHKYVSGAIHISCRIHHRWSNKGSY